MKELLYLKDEQLKDLIEKLFVSYRETFSDAKKVLDKIFYWFGSSQGYSFVIYVPRYFDF